MAETVFSSIKRTYGEYVSATKLQNIVKEMMMKVSLYNLFRKEWHKPDKNKFYEIELCNRAIPKGIIVWIKANYSEDSEK